jgi:hypothetical protein
MRASDPNAASCCQIVNWSAETRRSSPIKNAWFSPMSTHAYVRRRSSRCNRRGVVLARLTVGRIDVIATRWGCRNGVRALDLLVLQHPQYGTNFLLMSEWRTALLLLNRD